MEFPYGRLQDAYLNVKEAAKEPWRGITAWVQGNPWLVIDHTNGTYVLENEQGETFVTTNAFERWQPATEHSSLVAASRLDNSPFAPGSKAGTNDIGNLIYFEKEWDVRLSELDIALPIEQLVEQYEKIRWSKTADLYPAMALRCPQCGNTDQHEIQHPDDRSDWLECYNCGYVGDIQEFENEEPDRDDIDPSFYPDWTGAVKQAEGVSSFEYNLPPASIHMRTHAAMRDAGLQARVNLPPELVGQPTFMGSPYPDAVDVPATNQADAMALMMLDDPERYNVRVETPHDPEAVRQIFDNLGGRRSAKIADVDDREIKWVVLPGGEVVMEDPSRPVSNHLMLLAQAKGPEFIQQLATTEPHVLGLQGMINDGKINVAGYVMSDLSMPDRTYDPSKSWAGHVRVQKAVDQVRNEASARGIPLSDDHYSVPRVTPGEGVKQINRPFYDPLIHTPYRGKVAGEEESTTDLHKALTCPRCGSHTLRAYSPNGNSATLVCLTCGKEFEHDVHINPEASIKESITPIDPNLSAQVVGLMQQIEEAYQSGDHNRAQQLHQQMMQLMNTGQPLINTTNAKEGYGTGVETGPQYPADPARKAQIAALMTQIADTAQNGDINNLRILQQQLEQLLGGNPAYARVSNDNLESTPEEYNLDTMTFEAQSVYDDSYGGQPVNLDDYTQDDPMDSGSDLDYAHCPQCDGPGVLLGQLGDKIHYRCRNCGVDFNESISPNHTGPERQEPYGEGLQMGQDGTWQSQSIGSFEDAKEVNENTLKSFKDSGGNPIEAGKMYTLHHPSYKVPDVIKILNLEDDRIEASIASDRDDFPIHITHDDAFSLDPYDPKTASGWSVIARRNFTADEQQELIDENLEGRARNFDKLDLAGTHYQIKEEASDPNFLLGL